MKRKTSERNAVFNLEITTLRRNGTQGTPPTLDSNTTLQRATSLSREKAALQHVLITHMAATLPRPTRIEEEEYKTFAVQIDPLHQIGVPCNYRNVKSKTPSGRMTKLDYVAVKTRDPRQFKELGLNDTIRFKDDIKLCIVITFYNEPAEEVLLTIRGICENLKSLNEKFLDPNYWKHVCVVLLADGRAKLDESTAELLELAGIYDESLMDLSEDTGMHMFQSLPVFTDDPWMETKYPPLQTILMLKEKNQGKISSHWWFFEANCAAMDPQYCIMFDVGTKPLRNTLFSIYRCFERNSQITGISGELFCREVGNWNPIIAAQQIDYKFGTIMDRATESITGYLSVLPGCLSAYRWSDLQGAPLRVYFETLENPNRKWTVFESLVNLADDRLLCLELFCLPNRNATLHYLKDAVAESDVCMNLAELMKQRRRWINSATATLIYMIGHFGRIWSHKQHSFGRKLGALLIMIYYSFLSMFTFVSVGIYTLFLDINMVYILQYDTIAITVFRCLFYLSILLQIYTGYTSLDVKKYEKLFYFLAIFYAVLFIPVLYTSIALTIDGSLQIGFGNILFVGLVFNFGVFFILGMFHGHLLTMIVSFPQYLLCLPIFSIIIPVYCITNLHDLTWGTKSADKMSEEELARKAEFSRFRNNVFFWWLLCNGAVLGGGLTSFYTMKNIYESVYSFFVIFIYITFFWVGGRFLAACGVIVLHSFNKRVERKQHKEELQKKLAQEGEKANFVVEKTVLDNPIIHGFIAVTSILAKWTTVISLLNVFILSPCYCVLSVVILTTSLVLTIPLLACALLFYALRAWLGRYAKAIMVFFTDLIACIGIIWRYLATIEFSYNSFDGTIAKFMGAENLKKSGAGRLFVVNAWSTPEDAMDPTISFFAHVFGNEFTWRSVLYIIYIKPLASMSGLFTAVCCSTPTLYFLFGPLIPEDSFVLNYVPTVFRNLPLAASYTIGAILLFPFLWFVWYLDKNMRLITCWALASHVMDLDPVE